MLGYAAIKNGEQFHKDKKDTCSQGIGYNLSKSLYRFNSRVKIRVTLQYQADDDEQRWS